MNTPSHDFVTVDMRGLKAALVARARVERVSVSVLVRAAVARELGSAPALEEAEARGHAVVPASSLVKLSIRLTHGEAEQLATGARSAGLSRGAFLAGLIAGVPVLTGGANRSAHLSALVASCAELSTLSRNIRHLTSLLRQGEVQAAREYRAMFDTLGADIRGHLKLASNALSDLRPRLRGGDTARHPTP